MNRESFMGRKKPKMSTAGGPIVISRKIATSKPETRWHAVPLALGASVPSRHNICVSTFGEMRSSPDPALQRVFIPLRGPSPKYSTATSCRRERFSASSPSTAASVDGDPECSSANLDCDKLASPDPAAHKL